MRQLCQEFNLAGLNKDPLNKGILTGKYTETATFPEDDIRSQVSFEEDRIVRRLKTVEALREVLTANGRSMAQGAICYIWGLDERMIPIPGFKNVKQVEDNAGALAFGPMSAEEVAQVQAIVAQHEPVET
jgi:aryl-alcohol dehydrogenase-like predicted oxidoreductase